MTIADKLNQIQTNIDTIEEQTQIQSELIASVYDAISAIQTPGYQSAPEILVDTNSGRVTARVTQVDSGYIEAGTRESSLLLSDVNGNLVPENIKSGVVLFGVEGTLESGGAMITPAMVTIQNAIFKPPQSQASGTPIYVRYVNNFGEFNELMIDYSTTSTIQAMPNTILIIHTGGTSKSLYTSLMNGIATILTNSCKLTTGTDADTGSYALIQIGNGDINILVE